MQYKPLRINVLNGEIVGNILLPFGRTRRRYYWIVGFILAILMSVLSNIEDGISSSGSGDAYPAFYIIVAILSYLSWMLGFQRAHDIGKKWCVIAWTISVPVAFIGIIIAAVSERGSQPVVGIFAIVAVTVMMVLNVIFLFRPGEVGPNQYGDDPKRRGAAPA